MSYPARQYSGAGLATALTTSLSATATTISVADASTWTNVLNRASLVGTGGNYFTIIIDYGTVNEEKIQCSGLTNTSITVDTGGRGLDSTGPSAGVGLTHTTGASVMLCLSATEMAEINGAIQATVGNVAAIGDLIQGNGVNSFGRLAAGTAGKVLTSNGAATALSWTALPTYNTINGNPAGRMYALGSISSVVGVFSITSMAQDFVKGSMTYASNGLTVPVAGIYSVQASIGWQGAGGTAPPGTPKVATYIKVNGTYARSGGLDFLSSSGVYPASRCGDLINLAAGSVLSLAAYCDQNNLATLPDSAYTYLSAALVSI